MPDIFPDTPVSTVSLPIGLALQQTSLGETFIELSQLVTEFRDPVVLNTTALELSNFTSRTEIDNPFIYDLYLAYLTFECPALPSYGGFGQLYPWSGVLAGQDGKVPVLRKGASAIQWSYEGQETWTDLIQLEDISGNDGTNAKQLEIRSNDGYIQWRREGEEWSNIISLASISGNDGRDLQLQVSETHIQKRYADENWEDIISLDSLKGDDGDDGIASAVSPLVYDPETQSIELGQIGDGIVLVLSDRDETATARTNYVEWPVPVPSGSFSLSAVRFGCHIDTTGSSSSAFSAYRRTAAGVKTSMLTGVATLPAGASLVDASATLIASPTFQAGDRVGVDLVGVGTGAEGLFAQFIFTRSPV